MHFLIDSHFYQKVIKKIIIIQVLMIFASAITLAQSKGVLAGKVGDKSTNEDLIGANILVVGTTTGTSTDIDGTYSIRSLLPGKYKIRVSYTSYQAAVIDNITIEAGKTTVINIQLEQSTTELSEVIVSAEALKSSEASILNIQKNSSNIVDGVSAELIKKNNSSDGTDVLKRMTGVTISDGKYAFIRGVSDRYNATMLNGANLPSTDPEKKSVSYDLFPSSLIENIITSKSFTPDKPANFSGGLVQINTIEFPNKFMFELSTGSSYNTTTTGKSSLSYAGGNYDFLGIDDGTRDLPSIISKAAVNSSLGSQTVQEIGRSFKNNWATTSNKMPFNSNFKSTIGDSYSLGENTLGFIGSLTYANTNELRIYDRNYYNYDGIWYDYKGTDYRNNVLWGALFNVSYKFSANNKISFKNVYNKNTDNNVITTKGDHYYVPEYREATSLQFLERSLYSGQLVGEHVLGLLNNSIFNWNINYADSRRKEPDTRKYWYSKELDSPDSDLRFSMNQATATRFYADLKDKTYGFSGDLLIKLFDDPKLPNFKIGYLQDTKDRDYSPRTFGFDFNQRKTSIALRDSVFSLPVQDIFQAENINPNFIYVIEVSNPSDSYNATEKVKSTYFMFNSTLFEELKLTGGFRYEYSNVSLSYANPQNYLETLTVDRSYNDVLPSINLTYALNDIVNIRSAYGRTIARPELREMAVSGYYDFLTDDYVFGNPDLVRTLIDNYDLRFEYFPNFTEMFAVNFFYKYFDKPIEVIGVNTSSKSRSWKNADNAKSYGVEFEVRKNLGFISNDLKFFSFVGNLSLIKSEVDLGKATTGQAELEQKRALQGQADYVSNVGLYYDNYESGFTINLVYNKVGEKIVEVGVDESGDIISKPRDQIDFNLSKKLFDLFTLKFAVKDLLAQDEVTVQKTRFGDKTADSIKRGRIVSLGISYQLN
jgi:outer membrane receptor protein involved in Fe transport